MCCRWKKFYERLVKRVHKDFVAGMREGKGAHLSTAAVAYIIEGCSKEMNDMVGYYLITEKEAAQDPSLVIVFPSRNTEKRKMENSKSGKTAARSGKLHFIRLM